METRKSIPDEESPEKKSVENDGDTDPEAESDVETDEPEIARAAKSVPPDVLFATPRGDALLAKSLVELRKRHRSVMKSQHTCLVSKRDLRQANALKHFQSAKGRTDTFYMEAFKPVYVAIDGIKNRQ